MLTNKRRGIFKGEVFLVNPKHTEILGEACYPKVSDLPRAAETVIVAVPSARVPGVVDEAGQAGAVAGIVISSGFAEIGNIDLEKQLVDSASKHDLRILGPNCLGVYDPYTGMDTLFLPETKLLSDGREVIATPRPRAGAVSLLTQSGAFGCAALDYMAGPHGIGIRRFVSYGNRCDVTESELLAYFADDPKTKVILTYLEGLTEGREFVEKAKEITIRKPVVALKAGRSEAGKRAAASHTAALAGSDQIYQGAFRGAGIIRAENVEEFFDFARALAMQPPSFTNNVAVVTNAGGPGIIATDALEGAGLEVRKFPKRILSKFSQLKADKQLLPVLSGTNPIDLTAEATGRMFSLTLSILLDDPSIGGILLIALHHAPTILDDAVGMIAETISEYTKPVTVCDMGETEMAVTMRTMFEKRGIPSFSMPERAARALWALAYYGRYLRAHRVTRRRE